MLLTDAELHAGKELERAINRMDFFRFFRGLSAAHGFGPFGLLDVSGELADFRYAQSSALHSWPDMRLSECDRKGDSYKDPLINHLYASIVPRAFAPEDMVRGGPSLLMTESQARCAFVVPLHAPTGRRYGLVLTGNRDKPEVREQSQIAYEAMVVFQRYYEVILSLESMTGLTDREIQIVRWTSEGKTAAEVAMILGLSEHTVNSYTATILRKLQVANRAQMVATALRSGLIN